MKLTQAQRAILLRFDGIHRDTLMGDNMFRMSRLSDVVALSDLGLVTYRTKHRTIFVQLTDKGSDFIYEGGLDHE